VDEEGCGRLLLATAMGWRSSTCISRGELLLVEMGMVAESRGDLYRERSRERFARSPLSSISSQLYFVLFLALLCSPREPEASVTIASMRGRCAAHRDISTRPDTRMHIDGESFYYFKNLKKFFSL
jgi:hypothetical protein